MSRVMDTELLTIREVAGILRMSWRQARKFLDTIPSNAVIRGGGQGRNGGRFLIHAWALEKWLQIDEKCPGCGREWPK